MVDVRRRRKARLLVVNLHATSKPALVIPWLWAQLALRRIDAVLLQECTPAHARWLRRRRRWQLVGPSEAVYARRRLVTGYSILAGITPGWWGHQVGRRHIGRTLPLVELAGWLTAGSVHFPPAWFDHGAPDDRRRAGLRYVRELQRADQRIGSPALLAGDWNALPDAWLLEHLHDDLQLTVTGDRIDHAAARGCTVTSWRPIGRGPGMDHRAWLAVVWEDS